MGLTPCMGYTKCHSDPRGDHSATRSVRMCIKCQEKSFSRPALATACSRATSLVTRSGLTGRAGLPSRNTETAARPRSGPRSRDDLMLDQSDVCHAL